MEDIKPGIKTTELWFVAAVAFVIIFGPEVGVNLTTEQQTALVTLAGVYTGSRTLPKGLQALFAALNRSRNHA